MERRTDGTGGEGNRQGNNGRAAGRGAGPSGPSMAAAAAVCAAAAALAGTWMTPARAEASPAAASALGARWEGKALRVEGAGEVACVRYSAAPGECEVHLAREGGRREVHRGTCSLGAGRGRGYLEIVCRAPSVSGANADACVPGKGLVVVNMTAGFALSGDEDAVTDTSLPRRVSVAGLSCDGDLAAASRQPMAEPPRETADEAIPTAPLASDAHAALQAKALPGQPRGASALPRDRMALKLARLEAGGARGEAKPRVAPSSLPEATVTSTLNANWNGRSVEMDTGSVVYCVNFTRAKGACTAFFKDKATQAVEGPSSGDCSVASREANSVLAFTFESGKPLRTTVTLRHAVAGHEEAFPGRNGQDFWRLRERPCLSSNF